MPRRIAYVLFLLAVVVLLAEAARILPDVVAGCLTDPARPLAPLGVEAERTSGPMTSGQFERTVLNELRGLRATLSGFEREAYDGLLARLHDIDGQAEGRPFLVVLAPQRIQVDPGFRSELLDRHGLDPADYCMDCTARRLGRDLREAGIEVLDLTALFRKAVETRVLYNRADTHWNREGNEPAVAEIAGRLRDTGLIDRARR